MNAVSPAVNLHTQLPAVVGSLSCTRLPSLALSLLALCSAVISRLSLLGRGYDLDIPFRAEHPIVLILCTSISCGSLC